MLPRPTPSSVGPDGAPRPRARVGQDRPPRRTRPETTPINLPGPPPSGMPRARPPRRPARRTQPPSPRARGFEYVMNRARPPLDPLLPARDVVGVERIRDPLIGKPHTAH